MFLRNKRNLFFLNKKFINIMVLLNFIKVNFYRLLIFYRFKGILYCDILLINDLLILNLINCCSC